MVSAYSASNRTQLSVLGRAIQAVENLTISDVVAIVPRLGDIASGGKLQYAASPPTTITAEVEKKKSAAQLRKEPFDRDAAMGFR